MKTNIVVTVLVAAGTLAIGCKKTEETTHEMPAASAAATAPASAMGTPTAMATATAAPTLSSDDKDFMTKAAQGGMLEVALGQQASQKGQAADVKTFGQKMVTDHTKADDELKQLATTKGLTLPTELDSSHKSKIDELTKLSGTKLDSKYAADMVDDHEDDVKAFEKASKDLKDPDIKAWATKTLPVLQGHLAMAKDMKAKHK